MKKFKIQATFVEKGYFDVDFTTITEDKDSYYVNTAIPDISDYENKKLQFIFFLKQDLDNWDVVINKQNDGDIVFLAENISFKRNNSGGLLVCINKKDIRRHNLIEIENFIKQKTRKSKIENILK